MQVGMQASISKEHTTEATTKDVWRGESDLAEEEAEVDETLAPRVSPQDAVEATAALEGVFMCEANTFLGM